jgi:N-acetyl-anhydromuramyl-L-alanine amidase AmpD
MDIAYLVVHCSASPQGRGDNAETIHGWHRERNWTGCGYHYVILENGCIERGRPEYWPGAHAKHHNHHSLGICLIGMGGDATAAQLESLALLLTDLIDRYPDAMPVGHNGLDPEGKPDCPGFDVAAWWGE